MAGVHITISSLVLNIVPVHANGTDSLLNVTRHNLNRQAVCLPATFQAVGAFFALPPPFTFPGITPQCVTKATRNFAHENVNT